MWVSVIWEDVLKYWPYRLLFAAGPPGRGRESLSLLAASGAISAALIFNRSITRLYSLKASKGEERAD